MTRTDRDLLPSNPELERAILGAVFVAPEMLGQVAGIVKAGDFCDPRNRTIYRAMLATNGQDPDLLTVANLLETKGERYVNAAGGESYLYSLVTDAPSYLLAPQHARQVAELARQRRIIEAAGEITAAAYAGKVEDSLELARALNETERETGRGWELRTLEHAYQDKGPRRYVVGGLLRIPSLSVLYGPSGDLKSMLCLEMALAVAQESPWLEHLPGGDAVKPFEVTQSPVLWVDVDMGTDELERRISALGKTRGIPPDAPFHFVSFPSPAFVASNPECVQAVIDHVQATGADLVIVDNLGAVSGGADENSSQMVGVLNGLRRIAELGGCAVLVIHHKTKGDRRGQDSLRGHSSIVAALDLALEVTRDEGSDVIAVRPTKNRGAPVQPFAALWTFEQDSQGELAKGRFFGMGKPEAGDLSKQDQAELCILKDMRDGMIQSQIVALVKENAGIGRNTTLAAINSLERQRKLYARTGEARGSIAYDRTGPV